GYVSAGRGSVRGRAARDGAGALLRPRVRVRDHTGNDVPLSRPLLGKAARGRRGADGAVVRLERLRLARQYGGDGRRTDACRPARSHRAVADRLALRPTRIRQGRTRVRDSVPV